MHKVRRVDPERREDYLHRLSAFASELRARFPIRDVLLFGSFARGRVHEASDMDVVIVGDLGLGFFDRIGRILELAAPYDLPIEPRVYTEAEWDEMVGRGGAFAREVLETAHRL